MPTDPRLIAIVGPCGAGKSTLARALQARGYRAKAIAQEHSFTPHMWQRITRPDVLIFLDASHPVCAARRGFQWKVEDWQTQQQRLAHARAHADFYLLTDSLMEEEVLQKVLEFLKRHE